KGNNNEPGLLIASADPSAGLLLYLIEPHGIDTGYVDVYATVKARVFIFEKTLNSNGILDMKILDAKTNAVLAAEKMGGEYIWKTQWGYFNGDERALTDEQRKIMGQKEAAPPSEQEMFYGFTQPIFDHLMRRIADYYRKY
ncbi:MAG: hypothetical protein OEX02_20210, partial [Cyclobacteriaceae bacterium]|nr:hypothetical protein [Cyclobacteriaceae bacterium]